MLDWFVNQKVLVKVLTPVLLLSLIMGGTAALTLSRLKSLEKTIDDS